MFGICDFLICASLVAQAPPAPAAPTPVAKGIPTPQGFSVVLVLGDMQVATPTADNIPAAARKALADMKDFLPYKGYRLLDTQWILGSERMTTRLRGVDEQEYQLTMRSGVYVGKLRVVFQLQEPGSAESTTIEMMETAQRRSQMAAAQDRLKQLELEAAALKAQTGDDQRAVNTARRAVAAQIAELKRHIAETEGTTTISKGRSIIDTSFDMEIGETVVVGTSRVRGGDKALIALLTAVPRGR